MRLDIIMFPMVSLGLFRVGLDGGLALWVSLVLAVLYRGFVSFVFVHYIPI